MPFEYRAKLLAAGAVISLCACGNSSLDCGSSAAQATLVELSKKALGQQIYAGALMASPEVHKRADNRDTIRERCKAQAVSKANAYLLERNAPLTLAEVAKLPESQTKGMSEADLIGTKVYNDCIDRDLPASQDNAKDARAAVDRATYTVADIRTTAKDKSTGALACLATLKIQLPDDWGDVEYDTAYRVEMTADGKMYLTVQGYR